MHLFLLCGSYTQLNSILVKYWALVVNISDPDMLRNLTGSHAQLNISPFYVTYNQKIATSRLRLILTAKYARSIASLKLLAVYKV